jgi:hypothetical protein
MRIALPAALAVLASVVLTTVVVGGNSAHALPTAVMVSRTDPATGEASVRTAPRVATPRAAAFTGARSPDCMKQFDTFWSAIDKYNSAEAGLAACAVGLYECMAAGLAYYSASSALSSAESGLNSCLMAS